MDSVTLTIIHNALVNICREMGISMMRTSYSPIFNESLDFSCVLFDTRARMMAQAEFCPSQIGSIRYTVGWTIEELGLDAFAPGDVIIHNDPYRGSGHIPEHMVLKPVFIGGELFAFVANVAHMSEIGGRAPGGFACDATEVYQEGLRLPPVKIVDRGQDVKDIWKIIAANHRTPRVSYADVRAMIGSLHTAEGRVHELVARYGRDTVTRAVEELMDLSERRMRAEIASIPDGEYAFADCMEDDGVSSQRRNIRVTVTIRGDELIADWTGTDPQALGPTNCTYGSTASAVYTALMHVTDPTIPKNEGCYRPVRVIAPPGTIVNVKHPGPEVAGHTEVNPRLTFMVLGALSQAIPERVPAADGGTSCNFLFGGVHPRTGEFYAHYHFEGVGWGGRPWADGNHAQCALHGNCRNTPVEVFETRFPWRTHSYGLVPDSGGAGRYRGGFGTARILEVAAEEITVSVMMDRTRVQPWGLAGGEGGRNSGVFVKRHGETQFRTFVEAFGVVSAGKFANVRLRRGDQVLLRSPGGGGYGDPLARPAEDVLTDVGNGLVTLSGAEKQYGVALVRTPDGYALDPNGTAQLRAARPHRPGGAAGDAEPSPPAAVHARAGRLTDVRRVRRPVVREEGRWEEVEVGLAEAAEHCDVCGKLLPARKWAQAVESVERGFCDPACADLYVSYWLPRYAPEDLAAEGGRRTG